MPRKSKFVKDPWEPPELTKGLADGLRLMNTRGVIGSRVNLNRRRARALEHLMKEAVYNVPTCGEHQDSDRCDCFDHYHAAILWVHQQIQKRWSIFELQKD